MTFSVRHLTLDDKMCQQVRLDLLEAIIPADTIGQVLSDEQAWEEREKKLNMHLMVYLIIALALFPAQSTAHVLRTISAGLRHVWPQPASQLANKSAISTRRKHLGEQPMQTLCTRVVHPIATPQTKGACRFGRVLVAVDSTVDNVPDTAANRAAVGSRLSRFRPDPPGAGHGGACRGTAGGWAPEALRPAVVRWQLSGGHL